MKKIAIIALIAATAAAHSHHHPTLSDPPKPIFPDECSAFVRTRKIINKDGSVTPSDTEAHYLFSSKLNKMLYLEEGPFNTLVSYESTDVNTLTHYSYSNGQCITTTNISDRRSVKERLATFWDTYTYSKDQDCPDPANTSGKLYYKLSSAT